MKIQTQESEYASEVHAALKKYSTAVDSALEAVQKLESISITAHLAEFFGVQETKTARMIQRDYLVVA